ncbi:hypothetical protein NC651_012303 [Populus alba x Populus x berolinensis]|nr:hypothetical protein NC651_012303 [Populus alba x Populus x berolinensis]
MPNHKEFQDCRGERLSPRLRTPSVGARPASLLTCTLGPNMDPFLLGQASCPKSLGSGHELSLQPPWVWTRPTPIPLEVRTRPHPQCPWVRPRTQTPT